MIILQGLKHAFALHNDFTGGAIKLSVLHSSRNELLWEKFSWGLNTVNPTLQSISKFLVRLFVVSSGILLLVYLLYERIRLQEKFLFYQTWMGPRYLN